MTEHRPIGWLDWESRIVEAQRRFSRGFDYENLDCNDIHDPVFVDDDEAEVDE
jgi:hypothetical protein